MVAAYGRRRAARHVGGRKRANAVIGLGHGWGWRWWDWPEAQDHPDEVERLGFLG
ncbi:MAG: hypothetical protein U0821_19270 [Chloroflexota bacterium]